MDKKIISKVTNAIESKRNKIMQMESKKAGFESRLSALDEKMNDPKILEDEAVFNKTLSEVGYVKANIKSLSKYIADEQRASATDSELYTQLSREIGVEIGKIRTDTIRKLKADADRILDLIDKADKEQRSYIDLRADLARGLNLPVENYGYTDQLVCGPVNIGTHDIERGFKRVKEMQG